MSTELQIWAYTEEMCDVLIEYGREAEWLWFHRAGLAFPDSGWLRLTPDMVSRLDRAWADLLREGFDARRDSPEQVRERLRDIGGEVMPILREHAGHADDFLVAFPV